MSIYLKTLNDNDFKKNIISRTLCIEQSRANCQQLFRILVPLSERLPAAAFMADGDKKKLKIVGMSYNSARDELFLADYDNNVVRVRDNAGDLRDVYRATHDTSPDVVSVCHMSDSDTLLVCSGEYGPDRKYAKWMLALSRNGNDWRETHRVQTDGIGHISCALSDSRVLIGEWNSMYMELFRVERKLFRSPRIAHLQRIHELEINFPYNWFRRGSPWRHARRYILRERVGAPVSIARIHTVCDSHCAHRIEPALL